VIKEGYLSILFTPFMLGNIEVRNRFVFSACEDNLGTDDGLVTDAVVRKNRRLARGEVGLIISSHLSVHPWGRTRKYQLGIYSDQMIPGLRKIVESVHGESGRIVFQLGHVGLSASREVIHAPPIGPSGNCQVNEDSLREIVNAFGRAAERAAEAGADGIQLHCAHGYLIDQFLSPFFNRRVDAWGGSEENRFRLAKEIVMAVKKVMPKEMILLVKVNAHDHTPEEGITPPLAAAYARRLAELGIDGLEISCGTSSLSPWSMCRGDIPVRDIVRLLPETRRLKVQASLERMKGRVKFVEGYNLEAAKMMRPVTGCTPLFAVGGWRHVAAMEDALNNGDMDLVSLCRPLIREPSLVKKIREGKVDAASCVSCNRCLIAVGNDLPARCYHKGFPK
jgi:2,4-dienoyl-CoA reductase-like NADH-dependent reductase (Old Yellow Enzyme family)